MPLPQSLHRHQQALPFLFYQSGETKELQVVFAHQKVSEKRHGFAIARQTGHHALGQIDDISHAAHIDQHMICAAILQPPCNLANHAEAFARAAARLPADCIWKE